LTSLEWLG